MLKNDVSLVLYSIEIHLDQQSKSSSSWKIFKWYKNANKTVHTDIAWEKQ